MKCTFRVALAAALITAAPQGASAATDVDALLDRIDDLWRGQSSRADISMTVKTAHYERSMRMNATSKGKDHTLVRIVQPLKEKGTATLKSGKSIYTYLPKTKRTIRLTSGMMGGSWMGSHFTNDDLVKESRLREDYDAKLSFEGARAPHGEVLELTLVPKEDAAVVWGKVVLLVEAKRLIPIEQRFFDEDGALARTMRFSEVKKMGDRELASLMRMLPADKPGEFTELRYHDIEFDVQLPADAFSVARLKRRR